MELPSIVRRAGVLRVLGWGGGVLFALLALILLLEGQFVSALSALVVGLVLLPPAVRAFTAYIGRPIPRSHRAFVGFIAVVLLLFTVRGDTGTPKLASIPIQTGTANESRLRGFTKALATTVYAYRDAVTLETSLYDLHRSDLTQEQYAQLLTLTWTRWDTVERAAEAVGTFIEDGVAFQTLPCSGMFPCALAVMPDQEREVSVSDTGGTVEDTDTLRRRAEERAELDRDDVRRWEDVGLHQRAFPEKGLIAAVQVMFGGDARRAKERNDAHQTELSTVYASDDAFNATMEKWRTGLVTGSKIVLFAAGFPAAVATGGALAATSVFLGGIDVGLSVGRTISVVFNDGEEGLIPIEATQKVLDPLLLVAGAPGLLEKPSEWKYDQFLYLNDLALYTLDPDAAEAGGGIVLDIRPGATEASVYEARTRAATVPFADGTDSGNEYLPPHLRGKLTDTSLRDSRVATLKALLANPETRAILEARAQELADAEAKRIADEKARDAQLKEIEARKEAERKAAADAASRAAARKELERRKVVTPAPVPAPAPPKPAPAPAPAPTPPVDACYGKTKCEACWCKGQACVCGYDSCHCE